MNVIIDERMKKFWLANKSEGWVDAFGFEMQIDEYRFSMVGSDGKIILSEVTSGIRVGALEVPDELYDALNSKARLFHFFREVVAHVLIDFIENTPFTTEYESMRDRVFELQGEMPLFYVFVQLELHAGIHNSVFIVIEHHCQILLLVIAQYCKIETGWLFS